MAVSDPDTQNTEQLELSPSPAWNRSRHSARRRLISVALLLFISGILFVCVVSWQRDQTRIMSATEAAQRVSAEIGRYIAETGHLPFQVSESMAIWGGKLELPYPDRNAIYRIEHLDEPSVLIVGPRQGFVPPRDAGCAGIVYDRGKLHAEWMSMDRVATAKQRREALLEPARNR